MGIKERGSGFSLPLHSKELIRSYSRVLIKNPIKVIIHVFVEHKIQASSRNVNNLKLEERTKLGTLK